MLCTKPDSSRYQWKLSKFESVLEFFGIDGELTGAEKLLRRLDALLELVA